MRRLIDILVSLLALALLLPVFLLISLLIFMSDRRTPFYVATRVGRGGRSFKMFKFRSMTVGADRTGVDSTSSADVRITPVGRVLRRFKIDELPQLINVLKGEMSLVGPRPNVEREVRLYTVEEKRLLTARPGISDLASIVFSDEGEILSGQEDPDIAYNQLIRPGKNMLALVYVDKGSVALYLRILLTTAVALFNRERALARVTTTLLRYDYPNSLTKLASRTEPLVPMPPPGATSIVTSRDSTPE